MLFSVFLLFSARLFFFNDTATTEIYTLSLHDALPIFAQVVYYGSKSWRPKRNTIGSSRLILGIVARSEEHTSELQSHLNLVCRLLLEKKKKKKIQLLPHKKKQIKHIT